RHVSVGRGDVRRVRSRGLPARDSRAGARDAPGHPRRLPRRARHAAPGRYDDATAHRGGVPARPGPRPPSRRGRRRDDEEQRPRPARPALDGLVAVAADRPDRDGCGSAGVELLPEVTDVELHLLGADPDRPSPDELEQLVAAQHLAGVADEAREELELERRQGYLPLADCDAELGEVDREIAVGVRLLLRLAGGTPGAAQEALDACDELLPAERLDDIVVGAALQPADAIGLLP